MNYSKAFITAIIAIVIIYIIGLPIDVMEVDAAQYANISSDMFKTGEYLQLYCRGYDYLDKPPFLFWISQPFYFLFGVHDWSFKMGALLFILLGLYATFQLGQLLFNKNVARFATLILGSTQAWFLITHDVRTDGILASVIVFSVWQWKLFTIHKKWKHLLGVSVGLAVSLLTKGPIGFVVPVMVIGIDRIISQDLKSLFHWKYIIGLLIIAICISPMLYGLYTQYDMHPGKTVSGGQVVNSGIRYFFWTQSFGRITGESVWDNDAPWYYFLPELMWSFLPWSLFFLQATIQGCRKDLKKNLIPLAGFILPFIMMSLSNYKLSHYIFICYPFLAILTGKYLAEIKWNILSKLLSISYTIVAAAGIVILGYIFNVQWLIISTMVFVMVVLIVYVWYKKKHPYFTSVIISSIALNIMVTGFVYYRLLDYQSPSQAGQLYAQQEVDKSIPIIEVGSWNFSLGFYAQTEVKSLQSIQPIINGEVTGVYWLYTDDKSYQELIASDKKIVFDHEFENYKVTRLKFKFLNPNTRSEVISKTHLVKVYL